MRRRLLALLALASALALSVPAAADGPKASVHIGDAWATAPLGAAKNGAAFMTLHNIGADDAALIGAASDAAERVELHRSSMQDGVMRMTPVDRIDIPARGHTALRPGGYHVMLIGARDIGVGDTVDLGLQFDRAPDQTVSLPVVQAGTTPEDVRRQVLVDMHRITGNGQQERIGTLALRAHPAGLLAVPLLQGLPPGPHAMHVHTNGDCGPGARDGQRRAGAAAGGHYDPAGTGRYAGPYRNGALGDMPNLYVEDDGTSTIPVLAPRLSLEDVRGRSIMIHAGADRYGPRLPGAAALSGSGSSEHGHGSGEDHTHHGGMRMYCGVIPDA
jgi:Cu-Zn family superoxide dismutase